VPGAFDSLARGVAALHRIAPGFPVSARCTVQARNASRLRDTVQAARGIGLRSISFLAADLASTAFNRPLAWPAGRQSSLAPELAELEGEIESLIAGYPVDGFVLESPQKLRRIVSHFRAHYGLEPHTAPRCNAPWVSAVVESNGDVRPCFFHPVIGNTAGTTLLEVLNGPRATAFRESLRVEDNQTCRRCVCSLFVPQDLHRSFPATS
jgi:MoaA/NifB/PqqE/SkfB family radical SAM enzyme